MIHALRSLAILAHNPWAKPDNPLQPLYFHFRVMPWDCDVNIHLTNGRYPQRLDHARTRFFLRIGSAPLFARQGWRSVLQSQTITFIREIKPFSLVRIESRVLNWDQKYFYFEHRFMVQGKLHAKCVARVAVLKKGKVQNFAQFLADIAAYHGQPEATVNAPAISQQSAMYQQMVDMQAQLASMRAAEAEHEQATEDGIIYS